MGERELEVGEDGTKARRCKGDYTYAGSTITAIVQRTARLLLSTHEHIEKPSPPSPINADSQRVAQYTGICTQRAPVAA